MAAESSAVLVAADSDDRDSGTAATAWATAATRNCLASFCDAPILPWPIAKKERLVIACDLAPSETPTISAMVIASLGRPISRTTPRCGADPEDWMTARDALAREMPTGSLTSTPEGAMSSESQNPKQATPEEVDDLRLDKETLKDLEPRIEEQDKLRDEQDKVRGGALPVSHQFCR